MEKTNPLILRDSVRLVVSDVDDTLAHPYSPAAPEIIQGLNTLLGRGIRLMLISGQGIENIRHRITNALEPRHRRQILVGTCSGAEVWGFREDGELIDKPFYSRYELALSEEQRTAWRQAMLHILSVFRLRLFPTMPKPDFLLQSGGDIFSIMYEDRTSQITFECVNSTCLSPEERSAFRAFLPEVPLDADLRNTIVACANALFAKKGIPVTARKAGVFAVDFAVDGADKSACVQLALRQLLQDDPGFRTHLEQDTVCHTVEIWGDKFSTVDGGTDYLICKAFPSTVRAMDFRQEDLAELDPTYNIRLWDGAESLCDAVIEYFRRSHLL